MNVHVPVEPFKWTPEAEEQLRALVGKGLSASQAGEVMGVSRNTMIGKARRMGLRWESAQALKVQQYIRCNGRGYFNWSQRAIDRLAELCAAKVDGRTIAQKLSHEFSQQITDKAVRTKAQYLGLSVGGGREDAAKAWQRAGATAPRKATTPKPPRVSLDTVTPARVSFVDLSRTSCRFPLGDPLEDDFAYCGLDNGGKTYCPGHHQLCYQRSA